MKARQALVRVTAGRYQKASKKQKRKILDEFIQSTRYHRCYASFVLSRHGRPLRVDSKTRLVPDVSKRVRKKREPIYGADVLKALKIVWMNLDFMCGKRLKAALGQSVAVMERCTRESHLPSSRLLKKASIVA